MTFFYDFPDLMPIKRYCVDVGSNSFFFVHSLSFVPSLWSMEFIEHNSFINDATLQRCIQNSSKLKRNDYVLSFLSKLSRLPFLHIFFVSLYHLMFGYILRQTLCASGITSLKFRSQMHTYELDRDQYMHSCSYVYVWRIVVKFQKRDAAHNNIACILYIPNEMHTLLTNFTVTLVGRFVAFCCTKNCICLHILLFYFWFFVIFFFSSKQQPKITIIKQKVHILLSVINKFTYSFFSANANSFLNFDDSTNAAMC